MAVSHDLAYNAAVLVVDAVLLYTAFRFRNALTAFLVPVLGSAVAFAVAGFLGRAHPFLAFRLGAYGLFLHGPILCLGCAFPAWIEHRVLSVALVAVTVLLGLGAVDGFLVEPEWLQVTRYTGPAAIRAPGIRKPVRIVVAADLQAETIGPYEKQALAAAVREAPDLLLFAGDYLQAEDGKAWEREAAAFREALRAAGIREGSPDLPRLGVFAVRGNVDPEGWTALFQGFPVTCVEETRAFDLGDGLHLTALSRADSKDPALKRPRKEGGFHVVLGHHPDFARSAGVKGHLLLAGHTHGGQVRIPGLGPLFTLSTVPRAWAAGRTVLEGGRTLLVSRGIGLERGAAPRIRLFCRPEIVVIDLVPCR